MKGILAAFTLVCVLAQQTFGAGQAEVTSSNRDGSLLTDQGTCYYRGMNIPNGQTVKLSNPCEQWTCLSTAQKVTVKGCKAPRNYGDCPSHFKEGEYPKCCPGILC
uniref:Putative 8.9 kDa protein n=1 Tax=Ixodes ricinus TaxID=34613 RepID=A0A0K8REL5_IXORI